MAQNRVHSFSIRDDNTSAIKLVNAIKLISISKGIKFSFIVLAALKLYKEQVLDHE